MLVCARLRYIANSQWGNKRYMSKNRRKRLKIPGAVFYGGEKGGARGTPKRRAALSGVEK
jgi:hypothetical protein